MNIEDYIKANVPELVNIWYENSKQAYDQITKVTNLDLWSSRDREILAKSFMAYQASIFLTAAKRTKDEHPTRISYARFYKALRIELLNFLSLTDDRVSNSIVIADRIWNSEDVPGNDLFTYWIEMNAGSDDFINKIGNDPGLNLVVFADAGDIFSKSYELFNSISRKLL